MSKNWCLLHIRNGEIQNKSQVKKLFDQLRDGKWKIEIERHNKRTTNQNDYYWQMLSNYIQPALLNAGWQEIKTKEDAHEFVKELFLKIKMINETTGETMFRVKSTTELNTTDFNVYLEEIWQWASQYLMITIPAPNEQLTVDL